MVPIWYSPRNLQMLQKYEDLKKKMEKGERVKAKVVRVIKGGLLLDIDGLSAFLPQSQIGSRKGETLESSIGKEIEVKLIEVEAKVKRVIASRLNIVKEERERQKKISFGEP